jgi:hypothetical protein
MARLVPRTRRARGKHRIGYVVRHVNRHAPLFADRIVGGHELVSRVFAEC